MSIVIKHYKRLYHAPNCKSMFSIYIPEADLYLRDIREMVKPDGARWFSYPSRDYETPDGRKKYIQFYQFGKEKNQKFQAQLRLALMDYRIAINEEEMEKG